jgi:PPM family protein phosphatase
MLRVAEHFERSDTGRQRRGNEDAYFARSPLFAVADGMGGAQAGEVASRLAVEVPEQGLPEGSGSIEERLRARVREANARINAVGQADDQRAGMGTTLTVAHVGEDELTVAHVGDSRLYLIAGDHIRRLTHDDSWMASMLAEDPTADVTLLDRHPMRNALTNAVGTSRRTDVHVVEEMLRGGELLLLSTDGVHGELDDDRIEQLMLDSGDLRKTATNLVAAALLRGSHDNCTALVARYVPD